MLCNPGDRTPFREEFLFAGEETDGQASGPQQLFPWVNENAWREGLFQLCWRQHGGSGLGISMSEALNMTPMDRDWFLERISDQRAQEARQIEKAAKRK